MLRTKQKASFIPYLVIASITASCGSDDDGARRDAAATAFGDSGAQDTSFDVYSILDGNPDVSVDAGTEADAIPQLLPIITGFSPAQGAPGEQVTIVGQNLAGTNSVANFNGVSAVVLSGDTTSIVAVVPVNASSGLINVTTNLGTAASATPFIVTAAFVYASHSSGIVGFGMNAATGALVPLATSPYAGVVTTLAEHPSGKFLYSCNYTGNTASAYAVASNGALTAIGTPIATGSTPEVVKVHPSGKFLYVGTIYGGGTSIYDINATTGALTATTGLSYGPYNHGIAFDPTGKYFFLARNNTNDVTRFMVDATTGAPSDPKTIAAAGGYHATVDPQGRFLFVSDWDKGGGNKISVYTIATTDGTLTKVADYPTGGTNPAGVAVTADGKWAYVVNNSSGTVAGFSIDRTSGVLTAVPGSPFTVGPSLWELCIDRSGRWLYVGQSTGLAGFSIDSNSGELKPLAGSPFAVTVGGAMGACAVLRVPR